MAMAWPAAVDELIANGGYAKIFGTWGAAGAEITKSAPNPLTTF